MRPAANLRSLLAFVKTHHPARKVRLTVTLSGRRRAEMALS